MHDDQPIQSAARRGARRNRLGPDAVCILCGQRQLDALIPVKRSLLEAHHVLGKAHDASLTVPLCRNCHAIVTERLQAAGAPMRPADTLWERVIAILRAAGVFLVALGEALLALAAQVADRARAPEGTP